MSDLQTQLSSIVTRVEALSIELAAVSAELAELSEQIPPPTSSAEPTSSANKPKAKFYVVLEGRKSEPHGKPGIYKNLHNFADQVRDLRESWSGRGDFVWASGTKGMPCTNRNEINEYCKKEGYLSEGLVEY